VKFEVARALRLHESRRDVVDDYVRVFEAGDGLVVALVSASETGWESCWPPSQQLFFAAFAAELGSGLAAAFERAATTFVERAAALSPGDPDGLCEPAAQAIAVSIAGSSASLAWIGRHAIVQVRDRRVIARTVAHTLGNQRPELRSSPYAHIVTRVIRPGAVEPDCMEIALSAGDRLILVDGLALDRLDDHELCRDAELAELADGLVKLAFERGAGAYAACCVIQAL